MKTSQGLSVAILAGGLGTRLRPAVADRPKILAPVGGRPFVSYLLDRLRRWKIREVVLLVGHRAAQVRVELGDSYGAMRLLYSAEDAPLGTAGAVRRSLPLLNAPEVLLLNGDSFSEVDLDSFRKGHARRGAEASLVLVRVPDAARFGHVEVDETGRVLRFVEKGRTLGGGWINAGVYLLRRDLIADLPEGRPLSLERDVMPAWVDRGNVYGHRDGGRFLDIGTPESYAAAEEFSRDGVAIDREKTAGLYSDRLWAAKDRDAITGR